MKCKVYANYHGLAYVVRGIDLPSIYARGVSLAVSANYSGSWVPSLAAYAGPVDGRYYVDIFWQVELFALGKDKDER